jgi:hypothetical protein
MTWRTSTYRAWLSQLALGNNGKIHGEVDEDHFFGIYMGKSTISMAMGKSIIYRI